MELDLMTYLVSRGKKLKHFFLLSHIYKWHIIATKPIVQIKMQLSLQT